MNKFSAFLFKAGVLVTLISVVWWGFTFGQMAADLSTGFNNALTCLYSSGGLCGFAGGLAGVSYEPAVFWVGVALLMSGLVLGFLKRR